MALGLDNGQPGDNPRVTTPTNTDRRVQRQQVPESSSPTSFSQSGFPSNTSLHIHDAQSVTVQYNVNGQNLARPSIHATSYGNSTDNEIPANNGYQSGCIENGQGQHPARVTLSQDHRDDVPHNHAAPAPSTVSRSIQRRVVESWYGSLAAGRNMYNHIVNIYSNFFWGFVAGAGFVAILAILLYFIFKW